MKFKGQRKINICGFEYKKNIADSRRGGGPSTKKTTSPGMYVCMYVCVYVRTYVRMYVCILCMCVCMYVCMYVLAFDVSITVRRTVYCSKDTFYYCSNGLCRLLCVPYRPRAYHHFQRSRLPVDRRSNISCRPIYIYIYNLTHGSGA